MPSITTSRATHLSFLHNILKKMFPSREKLQVIESIITSITINMMNYLRRLKRSAKFLSHHQSMFQNLFSRRVFHGKGKLQFLGRQTRESPYPIAKSIFESSSLPIRIQDSFSFRCILSMQLSSTRLRTTFLMPNNTRIDQKGRATNYTINLDFFNSSHEDNLIFPRYDVLFKNILEREGE